MAEHCFLYSLNLCPLVYLGRLGCLWSDADKCMFEGNPVKNSQLFWNKRSSSFTLQTRNRVTGSLCSQGHRVTKSFFIFIFFYFFYFVQKYNNTGNTNDTWTGQLGIYHAVTVAHSKRRVIKSTYTLHNNILQSTRRINVWEIVKIDLFNCTLKRCEGTDQVPRLVSWAQRPVLLGGRCTLTLSATVTNSLFCRLSLSRETEVIADQPEIREQQWKLRLS